MTFDEIVLGTLRAGDYHPEDWTDDFQYENGMYQNICFTCKLKFIGHKRRRMCKVCYDRAVHKQQELF